MPTPRLLTLRQAAVVVGLALSATRALSADLHISLPTLSAPPGATVVVHLDASPGPNGLGIVAMDFALPLDPAIIQSSSIALDGFLQFNEYEVLTNAGKVSAEVARHLAEEQYDKFRVRQDREFKSDFETDFEAEAKRIESKRPRKPRGEP